MAMRLARGHFFKLGEMASRRGGSWPGRLRRRCRRGWAREATRYRSRVPSYAKRSCWVPTPFELMVNENRLREQVEVRGELQILGTEGRARAYILV